MVSEDFLLDVVDHVRSFPVFVEEVRRFIFTSRTQLNTLHHLRNQPLPHRES